MIKKYWKKFNDFFKPESKKQSKLEVAKGLYNYICKNKSSYLNTYCPICGQPLTVKDIEEEHFLKDHVVLIYQCNKKCQFHVQRRFTLDFDEIDKM